jgi:hypothetical protein
MFVSAIPLILLFIALVAAFLPFFATITGTYELDTINVTPPPSEL